jgi:Ca2+-binding RTX toxin-like protein
MGGLESDYIYGLAGDDELSGELVHLPSPTPGIDFLYGGEGSDILRGANLPDNDGPNYLDGGPGARHDVRRRRR